MGLMANFIQSRSTRNFSGPRRRPAANTQAWDAPPC